MLRRQSFLICIFLLNLLIVHSAISGFLPFETQTNKGLFEYTSTYQGVAVNSPTYDYSVSAFKDDDGSYNLFWCSHPGNYIGTYADSIGYAWSTSPSSNFTGTSIIGPGCAPTVIKVPGTINTRCSGNPVYLMYYESSEKCINSPLSNMMLQKGNRISLSFSCSRTGPWTKINDAVISIDGSCTGNYDTHCTCYGTGHPNAIFKDNKVYLFYYESTSGVAGPNAGVYLAESTNSSTNGGESFTKKGKVGYAWYTGTEVKYIPSSNIFLGTLTVNMKENLSVSTSPNSLSNPITNQLAQFDLACNQGSGILTNPQGSIIGNETYLYTGIYSGCTSTNFNEGITDSKIGVSKLTFNTTLVNSADCIKELGGTFFTARNNVVGLSNGDLRFLCNNSVLYECGWESTVPSFATESKNNDIVGNYKCDLTNSRWIIPPCTENNWTYSDTSCQPNNTLLRTWNRIGNCTGGITKPNTETITCNGQGTINLAKWVDARQQGSYHATLGSLIEDDSGRLHLIYCSSGDEYHPSYAPDWRKTSIYSTDKQRYQYSDNGGLTWSDANIIVEASAIAENFWEYNEDWKIQRNWNSQGYFYEYTDYWYAQVGYQKSTTSNLGSGWRVVFKKKENLYQGACASSLIYFKGKYYLYFESYTDPTRLISIYVARANNPGGPYEILTDNGWKLSPTTSRWKPVIEPDVALTAKGKEWAMQFATIGVALENARTYGAGIPRVTQKDGTIYLFYVDTTYFNIQVDSQGNLIDLQRSKADQIPYQVFATSTDGINFTKNNYWTRATPVDGSAPNLWDQRGIRYSPEDKKFYSFFLKQNGTNVVNLMVRNSTDGKNWTAETNIGSLSGNHTVQEHSTKDSDEKAITKLVGVVGNKQGQIPNRNNLNLILFERYILAEPLARRGETDKGYYGGTDTYGTQITLPRTINGECSTTVNQCIKGTYRARTNTTTHNRWYCDGINGGTNVECQSLIPTPTCTQNDWTCNDWGACQSNGTQTKTCTKNPNCQNGYTPTTTQPCIYTPACTESDWTKADTQCQSNNTLQRTWTNVGTCSGGITHTSPETIQCTYTAPTCTSFTYTDWAPTTCSQSGTQTKTILTSTPTGCQGGNPEPLTRTCTYIPTCTDTDWTPTDTPCQPNNTLTRTWDKMTNCQNGIQRETEIISCTYQAPTCTTFTYNDWSPTTCPQSATQTRTIKTQTPNGCQGGNPQLTQSCIYTPTCTDTHWTYTDGQCQTNNTLTRTWNQVGTCTGGIQKPQTEIIQCNYQAPTCTSFTYTNWSPAICPQSGTQTKNIATKTPTNCQGGNPEPLTRTCTYIPTCTESDWTKTDTPCQSNNTLTRTWDRMTNCQNGTQKPETEIISCTYQAPTCTSFTYSTWSPAFCPQSGIQTKTILTSTPTGCQGGNPEALTRNCTYTPTCTDSHWSYTDGQCQTNNTLTRTWNQVGTCIGGIQKPQTEIISCNYQAPTCTSFTYTNWSPAICPQSGTQTKNIATKTPLGCQGGNPEPLTRTCTYIPTCTDSYWDFNLEPNYCPSTETQTKKWFKINNCQNGITKPTTETITCNYQTPTCNYDYTEWSECTNGIQTRTANATNQPCQGNPTTTQTCETISICTENHWSYSLSECVNGTQTKNWTKTSDCNNGINHTNQTITCTEQTQPEYCGSDDWTSRTEPTNCPSTGTQTKYWTRTNTNCQDGVIYPAQETINCTPQQNENNNNQNNNNETTNPENQNNNGETNTTPQQENLCTEQNWTYEIEPNYCPTNQKQIKYWTKTTPCENGTQKPNFEIIECKNKTTFDVIGDIIKAILQIFGIN